MPAPVEAKDAGRPVKAHDLAEEADRLMNAAMEDGLRVAFGSMRAIPADGVTGEELGAQLAVFHETTQQVWAGMVERHGNYALVGALYGLSRLGALVADMVVSYGNGTVTRDSILNDLEFGVIALAAQHLEAPDGDESRYSDPSVVEQSGTVGLTRRPRG